MTRTLSDARAKLAEALQAFSAAQSSVPALQAAIAAGRTPGNDELAELHAVRPALDVAARAMGLDPEGATLADLEARLAAWEEAVALRRRLMRLAQATGPAIIAAQLAGLAAEAGRLAVAQAWSPEEAARAAALGRLVELADAATRKSMFETATEPVGGSADQFARVVQADSEKYERLSKELKIKVE